MDDRTLLLGGIRRQAALVRAGEVSSRELVQASFRRIAAIDPRLRAFTVVLADCALAEARDRDTRWARDRATVGPLHGVPVAIKAENDVAGVPTTYGGAAGTRPAAADSATVAKLRAAGAVVVGITAMPEFGQWPFSESSAHGYVRNPWDPSRSTFGSSGGSAAAVAAGMVGAALGGDAGGSIRLPAAACGLYGLKPQRGRVSAAPHAALWGMLGTYGPLTRSVADTALFYDVVAGSGDVDRFRAQAPEQPFAAAVGSDPGQLRIAVSLRSPVRGVRPCQEHVAAVRRTAEVLSGLGHVVVEADPTYPEATAIFTPQMLAGLLAEEGHVDRPELLERRTRAMLRLAHALPAAAVRTAERRTEAYGAAVNRVFDTHDLLLTPVTPGRPPRVGVLDGAGAATALRRSVPVVAYAGVWNLAGNPAASIPVGVAEDGLPVAVQLVGRPAAEADVLAVSAQLEAAQPWADRCPPIS